MEALLCILEAEFIDIQCHSSLFLSSEVVDVSVLGVSMSSFEFSFWSDS
jgi:hypothetical protein